jgi:proton-coupled amino acid transporter
LDPPEDGGRSFWAGLIKICLAIALIFTYPVMLFPVIKVMKPRLEQFCGCTKDNKYMAWGIRFILVTLTGIIVMEVPNFNSLMSLIGATTCTTLAFIMPGLCHYSLFRNELTKSQMCLDLFLAGFGILLAIVGTYDAVNKYNYPDPNHPHVPPIPIAKSHLVQTATANSINSIGS